MSFETYLSNSLNGEINNQFLMGIYLSAIVFTIRSYWDKWLDKRNPRKKPLLELAFFIFIMPTSLIALIFFIEIFWIISLLK